MRQMTHDERSGLGVGKARGDGRGGPLSTSGTVGRGQPCWLPELTHGAVGDGKPLFTKLFAGKAP